VKDLRHDSQLFDLGSNQVLSEYKPTADCLVDSWNFKWRNVLINSIWNRYLQ